MHQNARTSERRKLQNRLAQRRHRAKKTQYGQSTREGNPRRHRNIQKSRSTQSSLSPLRHNTSEEKSEPQNVSESGQREVEFRRFTPSRRSQSSSKSSQSPDVLSKTSGVLSCEPDLLHQEPTKPVPCSLVPMTSLEGQLPPGTCGSAPDFLDHEIYNINVMYDTNQIQQRQNDFQDYRIRLMPSYENPDRLSLESSHVCPVSQSCQFCESHTPTQPPHQWASAGGRDSFYPDEGAISARTQSEPLGASANIESWTTLHPTTLPVNQTTTSFPAIAYHPGDHLLQASIVQGNSGMNDQVVALNFARTHGPIATGQALLSSYTDHKISSGPVAQSPSYDHP